jgi:hypothetical protein
MPPAAGRWDGGARGSFTAQSNALLGLLAACAPCGALGPPIIDFAPSKQSKEPSTDGWTAGKPTEGGTENISTYRRTHAWTRASRFCRTKRGDVCRSTVYVEVTSAVLSCMPAIIAKVGSLTQVGDLRTGERGQPAPAGRTAPPFTACLKRTPSGASASVPYHSFGNPSPIDPRGSSPHVLFGWTES